MWKRQAIFNLEVKTTYKILTRHISARKFYDTKNSYSDLNKRIWLEGEVARYLSKILDLRLDPDKAVKCLSNTNIWVCFELLFGTKFAHCFSDVLHRILTESNSQNIAMKWASLHGVITPHIIWKQTLRYRIASLFFSVFRFPFVICFRWGCVKILQIVEVSCWNMSRPHVVNNSCWWGFAYFCFSLLLRLIFFQFLAKDFKLLLWYWFRYV